MVTLIPPPDPHTLVPPVLACLPIAFASARPPPALLPLLSPILRQRVQLLTSVSSSGSESWLKLLCWDKEKADTIHTIVEEGTWEPHPSSGEIEIGDVEKIQYKRFDEETLRARISLPDFQLTIIYLWCTEDQGQNGWRVTELVPYESDADRDSTWSDSITEANASSPDRILSEALRDAEAPRIEADASEHPSQQTRRPDDLDDDDDYWAQYDRTPGRTPAIKQSPGPQSLVSQERDSEAEYYARYASVQPALDPTDPSEEDVVKAELNGHSSLNGNHINELLQRSNGAQSPSPHQFDENAERVSQPHPSRPPSSSSGSDAVARLEESAEVQSTAEVGVRQHISTSMKSMYRLARSTGMDQEEFKRVVEREMEVLEMVE